MLDGFENTLSKLVVGLIEAVTEAIKNPPSGAASENDAPLNASDADYVVHVDLDF